jgi:hypothetical protein
MFFSGRQHRILLLHPPSTYHISIVYLPEGNKETNGAASSYDESLASLFWALNVPAAELPPEGGKAVTDRLQFCLDKTKIWDPA